MQYGYRGTKNLQFANAPFSPFSEFEGTMRVFKGTVFMAHTSIFGRGLQAVMIAEGFISVG
jgi:hypothetical protein